MLKSRYPITVCVDDKEFNIEVANETPVIKKRFMNLFKTDDKDVLKRGKLQDKLDRSQNNFKLNIEILSEVEEKERAAILREQKELNNTIFDTKEALTKLPKREENEDINAKLEEHNLYAYEQLVSGTDKESLKTYCLENGISFGELWGEFNKLKKEAKEKK